MTASSAELLARACGIAGSSDFGPDGWQAGFERLVDAVAEEVADPEAMMRIESLVVDRLVQRLRIQSWYAEHGDEAAEPVVGPLVIFGLPRTATTALHHLLATDPQHRYLRSWELADPVPPPVAGHEQEEPRRPADQPQTDVRHIVAIDGPAEDWPIHAAQFDHAELTLPLPLYSEWWRGRSHDGMFEHHERVLRLLHSHRPPHRWLLKLPAYLFVLDEMAEHYPDACFVMTHRDPVATIASTCDVVADSRRKRVPTWTPDGAFGRTVLDHWSDGMARAMAARDHLGPDRFVDVGLHELEADPVHVANRVYAAAGLPLDPSVAAAMAEWAARNRRGSRGARTYDLRDHGLAEADVTDAFEPYLDQFGHLC